MAVSTRGPEAAPQEGDEHLTFGHPTVRQHLILSAHVVIYRWFQSPCNSLAWWERCPMLTTLTPGHRVLAS